MPRTVQIRDLDVSCPSPARARRRPPARRARPPHQPARARAPRLRSPQRSGRHHRAARQLREGQARQQLSGRSGRRTSMRPRARTCRRAPVAPRVQHAPQRAGHIEGRRVPDIVDDQQAALVRERVAPAPARRQASCGVGRPVRRGARAVRSAYPTGAGTLADGDPEQAVRANGGYHRVAGDRAANTVLPIPSCPSNPAPSPPVIAIAPSPASSHAPRSSSSSSRATNPSWAREPRRSPRRRWSRPMLAPPAVLVPAGRSRPWCAHARWSRRAGPGARSDRWWRARSRRRRRLRSRPVRRPSDRAPTAHPASSSIASW
jgi:hypothetical protein